MDCVETSIINSDHPKSSHFPVHLKIKGNQKINAKIKIININDQQNEIVAGQGIINILRQKIDSSIRVPLYDRRIGKEDVAVCIIQIFVTGFILEKQSSMLSGKNVEQNKVDQAMYSNMSYTILSEKASSNRQESQSSLKQILEDRNQDQSKLKYYNQIQQAKNSRNLQQSLNRQKIPKNFNINYSKVTTNNKQQLDESRNHTKAKQTRKYIENDNLFHTNSSLLKNKSQGETKLGNNIYLSMPPKYKNKPQIPRYNYSIEQEYKSNENKQKQKARQKQNIQSQKRGEKEKKQKEIIVESPAISKKIKQQIKQQPQKIQNIIIPQPKIIIDKKQTQQLKLKSSQQYYPRHKIRRKQIKFKQIQHQTSSNKFIQYTNPINTKDNKILYHFKIIKTIINQIKQNQQKNYQLKIQKLQIFNIQNNQLILTYHAAEHQKYYINHGQSMTQNINLKIPKQLSNIQIKIQIHNQGSLQAICGLQEGNDMMIFLKNIQNQHNPILSQEQYRFYFSIKNQNNLPKTPKKSRQDDSQLKIQKILDKSFKQPYMIGPKFFRSKNEKLEIKQLQPWYFIQSQINKTKRQQKQQRPITKQKQISLVLNESKQFSIKSPKHDQRSNKNLKIQKQSIKKETKDISIQIQDQILVNKTLLTNRSNLDQKQSIKTKTKEMKDISIQIQQHHLEIKRQKNIDNSPTLNIKKAKKTKRQDWHSNLSESIHSKSLNSNDSRASINEIQSTKHKSASLSKNLKNPQQKSRIITIQKQQKPQSKSRIIPNLNKQQIKQIQQINNIRNGNRSNYKFIPDDKKDERLKQMWQKLLIKNKYKQQQQQKQQIQHLSKKINNILISQKTQKTSISKYNDKSKPFRSSSYSSVQQDSNKLYKVQSDHPTQNIPYSLKSLTLQINNFSITQPFVQYQEDDYQIGRFIKFNIDGKTSYFTQVVFKQQCNSILWKLKGCIFQSLIGKQRLQVTIFSTIDNKVTVLGQLSIRVSKLYFLRGNHIFNGRIQHQNQINGQFTFSFNINQHTPFTVIDQEQQDNPMPVPLYKKYQTNREDDRLSTTIKKS